MRFILLLVLLLASVAHAQQDVCKSGKACNATRINTRSSGVAQCMMLTTQPGYSYGWAHATSQLTLGVFAGNNVCSGSQSSAMGRVNLNLNSDRVLLLNRAHTGAGTAALPSWSFQNDENSGLYSAGADQIGVATAGARSFVYSATPGYLEGVSSASKLILDTTAGACVDYNSTGRVCAASNTVSVSQGTAGLQLLSSVAATSLPQSNRTLQIESNNNRLYWNWGAPSATAPPIDFGGALHPVLERRAYGLDMGYESSSTPTFYPVAPRLGAASATVTVVDAAAAGTIVVGTSPHQFDARTSVTAAAAGSISSLVTTAFIRRVGSSPRWCQKVSNNSTNNVRYWLGITNALPGSTDGPATGHVSFRYSAATDVSGNWQACYANGVSTTCVTTGKAVNSGTTNYDLLCIDCREGLSTACTWWVNGVATNRITSGLPTGSPFFPYYSVEATSASSRSFYAGPMSVELY